MQQWDDFASGAVGGVEYAGPLDSRNAAARVCRKKDKERSAIKAHA